MSIFGQVVTSTKAVLKQLLDDAQLRELVTYRKWVSSAFDNAKGHNVAVYSDTDELKTIRLRHNSRSVAVANANVQVGDEVFVFLADDFPSDTSLKDLIVDADGIVMKVSSIDEIFGIAYSVTVESGGVQ